MCIKYSHNVLTRISLIAILWSSLPVISSAAVLDNYDRADNSSIGNGWIEKNPAAFRISAGEVVKLNSSYGYRDNLVVRPASEDLLDVEASVEFRITGSTAVYPQLWVRVVSDTVLTPDWIEGYILYINSTTSARVSRQNGNASTPLQDFALNSSINTTDRFRLRMSVLGTAPVVIRAYVERFNGSGWDELGQVTINDNDSLQITIPGTTGISGHYESGYVYDNFERTALGVNPVPVNLAITPNSITAGSEIFTLTVDGSDFVPASVVRWNSSDRSTSYVSSTRLLATIAASDVTSVGTATVTVFNPTPAGGESNAQAFTIEEPVSNPVPITTGISPGSVTVGGNAFTLSVDGADFIPGAVVRWNGADLNTVFVSSTQLQATVNAADIAMEGIATVSVFNPLPGGGVSNTQTITIDPLIVDNPVPVLNELIPAATMVADTDFTMEISGSGFMPGSIVRYNGSDRITTFVSTTQVEANITAADVASIGIASVTVFNPTPGGGGSNALDFNIFAAERYVDDFERPDDLDLGNAWIEKTPTAFTIVGGQTAKQSVSSDYLDNLVYRPSNEDLLDVEVSLDFELTGGSPGYPQIWTRVQSDTVARSGWLEGYILYINNSNSAARVSRQNGGGSTPLFDFSLSQSLNNYEPFRMRMSTSGAYPVEINAYVERFNGAQWVMIGEATWYDNDSLQIVTAGSVGFSGHYESGYRYDNFVRTELGSTVQLALGSLYVDENSGTSQINVIRSDATLSGVSVDYEITPGTATPGIDYDDSALSGTLVFSAGETSKSIPITIFDDALVENTETLSLQLSNPSQGVSLVEPAGMTLSISDNDLGGTVQFALAELSLDESAATNQIDVVRANGIAAGVTVSYLISAGTATPGEDYDSTQLSGILIFAAGETVKSIDIALIDDALVESTETLLITLSNVNGGAVIGATDTFTLNISDNDAPAAGDISFSQAAYTAAENAGTFMITISRTNGVTGNVSVGYSVMSDTATAGADYTVSPASGVVSFAQNESSKTIAVTIIDDTVVEGIESLYLYLSDATSGASLSQPATATLSIMDNDSGGQIQFSTAAVSRDESSGLTQLSVVRSNSAAAGVSVDYVISSGTATPGADYDSSIVSGRLTFGADELSRNIDITLFDDAIDENTETIILSLSNPQGGASLGAITTLTLSIIDNDTAPVSGSSVSFVGSDIGAQQEYARQTVLPAEFGVGEFTFQMWVKLDDSYPVGPTPSNRADPSKAINWSDADNAPYATNDWWWSGNFLLDGHNNGTFADGTFSVQFYGGGRVRWLFGDGGRYLLGVQAYPADTTPSLLDGLWHQITLVRRWSGNSSLLELWVDGMQIASETSPLQTNMRRYWDTWSQFISGQAGWFWGAEKSAALGAYTYEDYKGLVDEVRLWSRALSSAEIASAYNQAATGTEPGLVGLFRLDDGTGIQSCNVINTAQCINMIVSPQTWDIWASENAPLQ